MNTGYVVGGVIFLVIGLGLAGWGQNTASQCNFLNKYFHDECNYTTDAIVTGLVFLVIGGVLMLGGAMSKENKEQITY